MKVVDGPIEIAGRGILVVIDELPVGLEAGQYVRAAGSVLRWKVVGIETHAMPRNHTNGKPAGLLLRGQTFVPGPGVELEVDDERA